MSHPPGPGDPREGAGPGGPHPDAPHGAQPSGPRPQGADTGAGAYGGRPDAYRPAPQFGAYVTPGQAYPAHPVPGEPHPDNRPRRQDPRRRAPIGVRPTPGSPYVTFVVMGLIALVQVLQRAGSGVQTDLLYWPAVTEVEPWRMLTTVFLHGGLFHLLFNMYALWIAGQALERVVGRWRLVVLMVLTALGGSTAVLLLSGGPGSSGWITGVVGFSGAVMGLFGAILVIWRSLGQDTSQLLVLLGINLVIGFVPGWNISWEAHLGGMVVGAVLGLAWSLGHRRPTTTAVISSIGMAAVLVGTCATYLALV